MCNPLVSAPVTDPLGFAVAPDRPGRKKSGHDTTLVDQPPGCSPLGQATHDEKPPRR
jgi:hypothetical protein